MVLRSMSRYTPAHHEFLRLWLLETESIFLTLFEQEAELAAGLSVKLTQRGGVNNHGYVQRAVLQIYLKMTLEKRGNEDDGSAMHE